MVVDTSVLIAVLLAEPDGDRLRDCLSRAEDPILSTATFVAASIVMQRKTGVDGVSDLDALLEAAGLRGVALDEHQARLARDAYSSFGKGRHPAALNFGDCFAYALAKATERPLLFKGGDFAQTDVVPALA